MAFRLLRVASLVPRRTPSSFISFRHYASLPPRGPYTKLSSEDIDQLSTLLSSPSASLLTTLGESPFAITEGELAQFNVDWIGRFRGSSRVVVRPRSVEEVSRVLRWCNERRVAVVPQGGNTGLVGGSVPVHDELVLSLSSLSKIRSFDPVSSVVSADAGVVLESLDAFLASKGHIAPLDFGAKGSCQIGGNIATNAGGMRFLRYGSLHGNVLGLEVVLPDGRILNMMKGLKKDNTGLDLKQLFVGSEGSIGIITGVSLFAPKRPPTSNVALLALPSFQAVQDTFSATRQHLGEVLSAFEFFDAAAFHISKRHLGGKRTFESGEDAPFFVLVETSGSNKEHDDEKLQNLLSHLLESETIADGVLAQDASQIVQLWSLREGITESASKLFKTYKYDLSIPVPSMYNIVEVMRARFADAGLLHPEGGGPEGAVRGVWGFGHLGDGNLHLNIGVDTYSDTVQRLIEPFVYEWVSEHNGSISAEHGLGLQKAPCIKYSQSPLAIELMKQLKSIFDPNNILNPYKFVTV